MLVGTGLTVCPACGKVVLVALGFCELCSKVFPLEILKRDVADPVELELIAA